MSAESAMLKTKIDELERQINFQQSAFSSFLGDIRVAAQEEDYDEIISMLDQWEE